MKMEHTSGPWQWYWRFENDEANCGIFYELRPGQSYAVARCPRYEKQEQWEANARLIAASPDLLETLDHIRKHLQRASDGRSVDLDALVDMARAAIAKAGGE